MRSSFSLDRLFEAISAGASAKAREQLALFSPGEQSWGHRALCEAAKKGAPELIELLLPFVDAPLERDGRSPLKLAAETPGPGGFECVRLLAARSNALYSGPDGADALSIAVAEGNEDAARFLLPLSDPRATGRFGWTPFHHAVVGGRESLMRLLAPLSDTGARIDPLGQNALMVAAIFNQARAIPFLLDFCDPRATDSNGQTALALAIQADNRDVVAALAPVSDLSQSNAAGQSAFSFAAEFNKAECADLLLAGADLGDIERAVARLGAERMPRARAFLERAALSEALEAASAAPGEHDPSARAPGAAKAASASPRRKAAPRAL